MNNCPHCKSDRTQKVFAVYEQETWNRSFSGYSFHGGSFSGSGIHQSKLGKRFSPPQEIYAGWMYVLIAIGTLLFGLVPVTFYYLFRLLQSLLGVRTRTQYQRRLQHWHKA